METWGHRDLYTTNLCEDRPRNLPHAHPCRISRQVGELAGQDTRGTFARAGGAGERWDRRAKGGIGEGRRAHRGRAATRFVPHDAARKPKGVPLLAYSLLPDCSGDEERGDTKAQMKCLGSHRPGVRERGRCTSHVRRDRWRVVRHPVRPVRLSDSAVCAVRVTT